MKIISCHIDNFGKLSNFDLDFKDGTNVIFEDNGYGKSTLSSFLRVMLYGFDNETKKGDMVRERSRYMPWQGGIYGGRITIETNDKRYIIIRQFGKKDNEDFFEVRDAETMLVVDDFSVKIGEQIFGIDSESFKRSVMFSQNDCETRSTDGINAKLGNLTESTDDINNFNKVDEALHKLLNEMTDARKTGSRSKLKESIYSLQAELRTRESVEKEYHNKLELLEKEKSDMASLREQISKLESRKNESARNKSYYVIKEQYEKLIKERYELENELKKSAQNNYALFMMNEDDLPSEECIVDISDKINELMYLRNKKTGEEFSYNELSEYNRLSEIFSDKPEAADELDEALSILDEGDELRRSRENIETKLESLGDEENENGATFKRGAGICGVILGIAAIAFAVYMYKFMKMGGTTALLIGGVGAVVLIISIIIISSAINVIKSNRKKEHERSVYSEQLSEVKGKIQLLKNRLMSILTKYEIHFDKYDVGRKICRVRDDLDYYKKLCVRKQNADLNSESIKITGLCNELDTFFSKFSGFVQGSDYMEKLYNLKVQMNCYELNIQNEKKLNDLTKKISNMENEPDFLSVKNAYNPSDNGAIDSNDEIDELNRKIEIASENCVIYRTQIEAAEESLDILAEKEEELASLQRELENQNEKARLLEITRKYLNEAKTSFVKRYSEPITNNFRKYFELLDGSDSENYSFDANTNLNIYSEGKIRKPEAFSRGLRDLAGIAFRMSLTEAMFKNEKPYIIMDDPFVNLDDNKIDGALKLINNISEEYQVIYFTCSSSRVPNV